jgi:NAD(P)-dependent dehydrogenase (short-subunit alcohol dehydrogenase family)
MTIDFSDKNVIVTGGTGALGTAVVGALLEAGAQCCIPCRRTDGLKQFPFRGNNRVTVVDGLDLTDEAKVEALYAQGGDPLWASIHIAGGFAMAPIEDTPKADFQRQMDMNALTCFLCCRQAVKRMSDAGGGRIVNVAARPALEPRSGARMVAYTASKSAVAAMTRALAEEVVARGILVNAVAPSIMDTPPNRKAMPKADFSKWPKVEQIAATIVFLASPQNTATRGGLVPVYGPS